MPGTLVRKMLVPGAAGLPISASPRKSRLPLSSTYTFSCTYDLLASA